MLPPLAVLTFSLLASAQDETLVPDNDDRDSDNSVQTMISDDFDPCRVNSSGYSGYIAESVEALCMTLFNEIAFANTTGMGGVLSSSTIAALKATTIDAEIATTRWIGSPGTSMGWTDPCSIFIHRPPRNQRRFPGFCRPRQALLGPQTKNAPHQSESSGAATHNNNVMTGMAPTPVLLGIIIILVSFSMDS